MNVLHLENIASQPIRLNDLTFVKCSGTKLYSLWTSAFLSSIVRHYTYQQGEQILFAIPEHSFNRLPMKSVVNQEDVHPYLLKKSNSLYQLDCYLNRLKEEGTNIGLVVISDFDSFIDKPVQEIKEVDKLSKKHGCRFLLRTGLETIAILSVEDYLCYSVTKVRPSQREKTLIGSEKLSLFKVETENAGTKETFLSIRDERNNSLLYFPASLKPYLK